MSSIRSTTSLAALVSCILGLIGGIDCIPAAAQNVCAQFVYQQTYPSLPAPMLARTHILCREGFVALSSGVTRTGLWSAEHLTRGQLQAAMRQPRVNNFHPETDIPAEDRAELADYRGTGYDRGHLTPSGDEASPQAQAESFSLGQMCPQTPENNRRIWERVEEAVRNFAMNDNDVYVVTGPLFQGSSFALLNQRVYVPTAMFKAVYSPHSEIAGVYIANNDKSDSYTLVSVNAFQKATRIDPFPSLNTPARDSTDGMPTPSNKNRYTTE